MLDPTFLLNRTSLAPDLEGRHRRYASEGYCNTEKHRREGCVALPGTGPLWGLDPKLEQVLAHSGWCMALLSLQQLNLKQGGGKALKLVPTRQHPEPCPLTRQPLHPQTPPKHGFTIHLAIPKALYKHSGLWKFRHILDNLSFFFPSKLYFFFTNFPYAGNIR